MGPLKLVVADDHPTWRSGLRADLSNEFTIVGEAGTATDAITTIRAAAVACTVPRMTCASAIALRSVGVPVLCP